MTLVEQVIACPTCPEGWRRMDQPNCDECLKGWQLIETAPLDQTVLLWWVGNLKRTPRAPPTACIGQVSSHEPGKVWDGTDYRPIEWYTHWQPMPAGPRANGELTRND